jgi:hypothetical protein
MRGFTVSFFILSFLNLALISNAQTLMDARLFGQNMNLGNARFHSMSGSMGALGGNASAITTNIGGLGVYRRGEFSASLGISNQGFDATHYENASQSSITQGRLNHFNLTFSNELFSPDWKYFNLAFVYNRRNSFDSQYSVSGVNTESSKLDVYMIDIISSGVYVEDILLSFPFGAGLAWDVLLIDTLNGQYYHALENYGHEQKLEGKTRGGVSDYLVGGGANYQDKLYVGASLGISVLNYTMSETFTEDPVESNRLTELEYWQETTELNISGRGLQLKLGFLYWFTEKLRMGLAYNSGTNYLLSEHFNRSTYANWKNREGTTSESPDGYNEYRFRSPYNLVGSFALVDKYIGSLNLDVEWVTYGRMRFNSVSGFPVDFSGVNNRIDNESTPALNLRLGGELLLGSVLLRGGAAMYGNPQKGADYFNRYSVSLGGGYRIKNFRFDVSYSYLNSAPFERNIHFNESIPLQPTTMNFRAHQIMFTATVKFKQGEG